MTAYSSRSDHLWSIAQQLVEEEIKSIPFAQQEEHGQRIQTKYNQLVSNLSCVGDIIAAMYQKGKLELDELEQIQHLQSTPIRANEELLSIISRKPRDIYDCFLSLLKEKNQPHLYQMLVSGDDTCQNQMREGVSSHKDLIRRNFVWLSDKLETENGLISLLYQQNVLTVREREDIFSTNNTFRRSELLLGLLSKKSPEDFDKFLKTLEVSGQGHLAKKLSKPEGSPDDIAILPSEVLTPKRINHQLLPNEIHKSRQEPVPVRSYSKPVRPKKTFHKPGQKLIPSHSLSKPVPPPKPGPQSTSAQHYAKSMDTVAKTTEKTVNFQSTAAVKFQTKLIGLGSRLKTDIAVKVTDVSLLYFEKPEDNLKIFFDILLQECRQMRKEIVAKNVETNMELEQMRRRAHQCATAATLNEAVRTQLQSVQQELASERLQSKKERMQLEEKVNNLKMEIHNEKTKCKRLEEEKFLNKTAMMEMKDSFNKAECDKQFIQQQMHVINYRLTSTEYELQKSKEQSEESNTRVISLRTESEKLKEACEILRKENEIKLDLKVQLLQSQENNRDLLTRLKAMERSLEDKISLEKERFFFEKESSFELGEEENLELIKPQQDTVEEISQEDDRILKLQVELETEKHRNQELEDKLSDATAQLEQLNRELEGRYITYVTQDELQEKYKSDPVLIRTIRTKDAEERKKSINGLTILDKQLFVVSGWSSEIEVYDSIKLSYSGRWNLKKLNDPMDIASCSRNKCLYIFDFKGLNQSKEILRVDLNGKVIKRWSTGYDYGHGLSVTDESNVILTVMVKNKINEYSSDGQLFREIYLSSEAGFLSPCHCIKLTNGHFVICHGSGNYGMHRACIVDSDGKLTKSFGGERGSNIRQMDCPSYLSVDGNGFVLVADQLNFRILLLDSDLELKREILSTEKHGLQRPSRIILDESNGRMFVADNDYCGRILIFNF